MSQELRNAVSNLAASAKNLCSEVSLSIENADLQRIPLNDYLKENSMAFHILLQVSNDFKLVNRLLTDLQDHSAFLNMLNKMLITGKKYDN